MTKKKKASKEKAPPAPPKWQIVFFQRHPDDDPTCAVPGRQFLENCPEGVVGKMLATLTAVRDRPPPAFSGGGRWEAMHDEMSGYYEVRCDGPQRRHYRLFCILEPDDAVRKLGGPSIVIVCGMVKDFLTTFTKAEYQGVRRLGDEYMRRVPRSVAR